MRAWFSRWAVVLLLYGVALGSSARAESVADRLADLKQALQAVRAAKPSNSDRDAGPELTPVKGALRRWVEAQLPPPSKPGRVEGTIVTPDASSLLTLGRQMNDALDEAQLTCGDFDSAFYRCGDRNDPDNFFVSERGHVGRVQLGLLDYGRYLLVVTEVGVLCGEDQSAYLYKANARDWKLVFATERDDYRKGHYDPQNFLEIAVSPSTGEDSRAPLIATLGFSPWCSSNWNELYTRLWRLSADDVSLKPLIDRDDGLYLGGDMVASAWLTKDDFLVEYEDASIDDAIMVRNHVHHYRIGSDGHVQRIGPVALSPTDFVDEWLSSNWPEAKDWLAPGADKAALMRVHASDMSDTFAGEFQGKPKRCRGRRSTYQITFRLDPSMRDKAGPERTDYFEISWDPPYRFQMLATSNRPLRGCDQPASNPQVQETLFPDTQWHPIN